MNQDVDGAVLAASMLGPFGAMMFLVGLGVLTSGLHNISIALRNRVWVFGLAGANIGLGFLLARPPPEYWLSYISWTLGSFYIGLLVGLVSHRKIFLLEDEDEDEEAEEKTKAPQVSD